MEVFNKSLYFGLFLLLTSSCVSHKGLTYLHSDDLTTSTELKVDSILQYRLMPGDKLSVSVSSSVANEKIDIFNKQYQEIQNGGGIGGNSISGFQVDHDGNIKLPLIGSIYANGLTLDELEDTLTYKLSEFINYVNVKIALESFRITILGEVKSPATLVIDMNSVNLLQLVGMSGDFTEYANKKKIKLIRKVTDGYNIISIDASVQNVILSPYFQLMPNDVIYVPAVKARTLKVNYPVLQYFAAITALVLVAFNISRLI